jgi:hypothetical protein
MQVIQSKKAAVAKYVWFAVMIAFSGSCKKLIQIAPNAPGQIVTTQVFADSADATSAVLDLYGAFTFVILSPRAAGLTVYPALAADEIKNTSANSLQTAFYTNNILPANQQFDICWVEFYNAGTGGIYQANACLEGIKAATGLSANLKNQLIGEVEVVRSFLYFHLLQWFGGVPLATTTNYTVNAALPRASDTAVLNLIISDLKDAKTRLTVNYPSDGRARPNLYTAEALLAQAYLQAGDWQDALQESGSILQSGLYSLEPDLNQVFLRGSNEAIWQVQSVWTQLMTTEGLAFVPRTGTTIPKFVITNWLLDAFEPGDLRRTDWIDSNVITRGATTTVYPYPYKYKNGSNVEDCMVFRLGEAYLVHAEAALKTNDLATATSDLNSIRTRAGLAPYSGPPNADSLSQAIFHERQVELFCEWGNRWWDLKRNGLINEVLGAEKSTTWPSDGHASLFPIPLTEIQEDNSLSQNPGY